MTQNKMLASLYTLIAFALFVVMDSIGKYLADYCSVIQIVWGRYFFHILLMFLIFFFIKKKINFGKNIKIQILRSLLLICCTVLTYISVRYNELINFYIIFFSTPLIASFFSYIFLKEKVTKLGFGLIFLSFFTIVYSLDPSASFSTYLIIFPFLTAVAFSLYQLFTKIVAKDKEAFVALFYTSVIGSVLFSILAYLYWTPIESNKAWIILIFLGFIGFLSHYLFAVALQTFNLYHVTNFQYTQLIWASLINYFIFGDIVSERKIIGIVLIIILGLIFINREMKFNNAK
jgi:drug/metabolite transporter (DMT)-like permease|tara:strand:+ start:939 stop:1805 length:867 start_codon:yes stop_codon:yes gene_type:complete